MQGSPTSAADRALLLSQVESLKATGLNTRRACAEAGVLFVNYYRWRNEAAQTGVREFTPPKAKGRPAKFELSEEESRRLRFWRLVKGSIPLAVEAALAEAGAAEDHSYLEAMRSMLAASLDRGAQLRASTAAALRKHWQGYVEARKPVVWPMSVQRACRVSEDEEAEFRGHKARDNRVGHERRGAFLIAEDGQRLPWFAGAIWCSDDMSLNDPFRFFDAAAGREMVGRQAIFTTDAFSLNFLGCTHIGRDRDSYRAEDIADHFASLVDDHGLPLVWRIERGRWNNNFIFGCPIPNEFTDDGEAERFGGLDAIVKLAVKHSSRGKEIEGCFNLLQSLMDHGGDGRALSIGRTRGEFEAATRLMLRADRDADALAKFWSIEASAEHVMQAMRLFATRPKQRQTFGNLTFTPAELWTQHVKRPCPQNERWRFLPVKMPARVWKGLIEVSVKHYPLSFRFRVNGGSRIGAAHLVDGHEVMIAFHPGQAWEGCLVFNRDRSARNRDGWRWLERIGVADHMADAPQEDLSGRGAHSGGQKRQSAQSRREYRALIAGTEFDGRRRSHAQDGLGNALAVAQGGAATPARIRADEPAPRNRGGLSEGRVVPRSTQRDDIADFDEDDEREALGFGRRQTQPSNIELIEA